MAQDSDNLPKSSENTPDPTSIYTPEQAKLLLTGWLKIASKKMIEEGKPLPAGLEKRLWEIALRGDKATSGEYALKKSQLARALGLHRNTINLHVNDPSHPKRIDGLGWNIEECRKWYESKGVIKPGENSDAMREAIFRKMQAEAKKEEARANILLTRSERERGNLLETTEVCDKITEIIGECVNRLNTIPQAIAPLVAGKNVQEIESIVRQAINDCLYDLSEMPWLKEEAKKKLQAGNNSMLPSVEYFDRLQG
jgi:hypothetical protein